ncbi:uncharacterized protein LOC126892804 isoform X3 [Diabrotica virgifera virgifera]|uniref:Uncharacterized protein LOC114335276 n=1 Tax=Diabrotica virgifera virgifera TaxID=50390 RepID=A0A6P7G2Q7_DIAVI|nr:uncharacterized protein LOC126892804 isoform X3 [Diabrotica virgifera virgifera]
MTKLFLCIAVLCCVQYGFALLTPDKLGEHINGIRIPLQRNCKILTGTTQEQIEEVRKGNFDQGENMKNYAACIYLQSRLLNKNFDFDMVMMDYYMPPRKDLYLDLLKCNEKYRNTDLKFTDKVYNMVQCYYQRDPVNFVFF